LMVMAIGFGVAASMTTWSVFRAVSGDPIPWKSSRLFVPQIDNWGPQQHRVHGEPPDMLSYLDAMALMRAHRAAHQTALYPVGASVVPQDASHAPFRAGGYAAFADFFPMFDVPFHYGGGWTADHDGQRADVVVLGDALNRKLFGDADSVGREVMLDDHRYRVVGVMATWHPQPRFYDVNNGSTYGQPPDFFVPFNRAIDVQMDSIGMKQCAGKLATSLAERMRSECVWIGFWAELPTPAAVRAYRAFLDHYAMEQQKAGRFGWAPNVRLRDLMRWLDYKQVVPPETRIALLLAVALLLVCLINTVGLLLAKFLRRAPEIGVRRALGASRRAIHAQFLAEAGVIGLVGGALGLLLTVLGTFAARLAFESDIAALTKVDARLVGLTVLVSVAAALVAAFYPSWRAARVQPAWQLKSN
uniref:ABC transporter permease n=1 Tax=Frateuria defendens TaxID=2219559 RepID=UPI00066FE2C8